MSEQLSETQHELTIRIDILDDPDLRRIGLTAESFRVDLERQLGILSAKLQIQVLNEAMGDLSANGRIFPQRLLKALESVDRSIAKAGNALDDYNHSVKADRRDERERSDGVHQQMTTKRRRRRRSRKRGLKSGTAASV